MCVIPNPQVDWFINTVPDKNCQEHLWLCNDSMVQSNDSSVGAFYESVSFQTLKGLQEWEICSFLVLGQTVCFFGFLTLG